MTDSAQDPAEFRKQWMDYIKQVKRLRLSLPHERDDLHDEVDDAIETLEWVVEEAAQEMDND